MVFAVCCGKEGFGNCLKIGKEWRRFILFWSPKNLSFPGRKLGSSASTREAALMRISGNRFFRPRLMHDGAGCYFVFLFFFFPVVVLRGSVQWKWMIMGADGFGCRPCVFDNGVSFFASNASAYRGRGNLGGERKR